MERPSNGDVASSSANAGGFLDEPDGLYDGGGTGYWLELIVARDKGE